MMNRFVVILAMVTLGPACLAQRVLYSSRDIVRPYQGPAIRTLRPHGYLSPTLTVTYQDGRLQEVPRDSIWGYEDRLGRRYRYYRREFYRVLDADGLVRYSLIRPTGRGVASIPYFSQDYDSPLRGTKAQARLDSSGIR